MAIDSGRGSHRRKHVSAGSGAKKHSRRNRLCRLGKRRNPWGGFIRAAAVRSAVEVDPTRLPWFVARRDHWIEGNLLEIVLFDFLFTPKIFRNTDAHAHRGT